MNFVTYFDDTSLDTTSSNSTTTSDREYVLNRHQERFINGTLWKLNPVINCIHQLHNFVFPLCNTVQCTKCRTTNNRSVVTIELIEAQQLTHFHFNEIQHLSIVHHVALVHEYHQTWYVHLASQQDVFTSLWHRTIGSSNYDDGTIHLCGTSYHVLDIVSVTRAVYVCIVTGSGLILNVSGIDSNTTLFLFRCVIDRIEGTQLRQTFLSQYSSDSSGQSGFSVVYVTNSTDVNVWFRTVKFLFCHNSNFLFLLTLISPHKRAQHPSRVPFILIDLSELLPRVELGTSSLPRMRSTTELKQHKLSGKRDSNPRPPAWKASALSTELFPQKIDTSIFCASLGCVRHN